MRKVAIVVFTVVLLTFGSVGTAAAATNTGTSVIVIKDTPPPIQIDGKQDDGKKESAKPVETGDNGLQQVTFAVLAVSAVTAILVQCQRKDKFTDNSGEQGGEKI